MKKKIGISYSRTYFPLYWNWIKRPDMQDDIELVELNFEKDNTADISACDAFILTGGIDVDPAFYGGEKDYPKRPETHSTDRDLFEATIYHYAQLHKLPLLAICRGLQLVNVLEGGKLIQDLGAKNERHRDEAASKEHPVKVEQGSLLHQITGVADGYISTLHHQAVDPASLGKNLVINALDGDDPDIIEGMEFKDKTNKTFMLCVQWHPERMKDEPGNPFSFNLKKHFLAEVRKTNMKKLTITNPATEEIINTLNTDTADSLQQKYDLLKAAQPAWTAVPLPQRIKILQHFAELLEENKERLAATLTAEMGKPLQQARNEINGAQGRIKWLTDNAVKYLSDEIMSHADDMEERIVYEPLGVICNISAWNYPYLVGVNVFVPALLAGNAVLYKPSEHATLTGLEIERLLKRAGIPANIFHVAIGAGEVGSFLLDMPLDGYYFTGSYKTGQFIYEKVAPKMVPCQCELGGKDPLYVADDIADINAVAAGTADGAFYNNGQSCCAVERIYVHEKIYDRYLQSFAAEVQSWKTGQPTEEGIYIGPLSRKAQLDVLEKQIADAVSKGATILAGGKKLPGKGYFFEPTVLSNVNHSMLLMQEESFGPVIGIMKVKDDEEAKELMQDTEYGLTAAVYSANRQRAENILRQLNAGSGYWNCCDRVSATLPWSGRKHSGFGVTLSHAGLLAFVQPKSYHLKG